MSKDCHYVLGIHDGHNCGATLVCDGNILASISEGRLVRKKNSVGYPKLSIEAVLKIGGIDSGELSDVAFASLFMHSAGHLDNVASWYDVGLSDQKADERKAPEYGRIVFEQRKRERIQTASKHLGIAPEKIHFIEHHLAHLAAAYYTAPAWAEGRSVLGLTCDGAGDGLCATVSTCKPGEIKRLSETSRHASLGKIYSRITFLMGMTPWEHEYKLMGLAPYASPEHADKAAEHLRDLLELSEDGLGFALRTELSTNYCYRQLRDAMERVRFDTIAGATQLFTEEMLVAWVRSCIKKTGLTDIVCGGGVFMNVKANMLVGQIPELRSFYVMPSASDESLSIGACLHHYYSTTGKTDYSASRLSHLYLGDADDERGETRAIETAKANMDVTVSSPKDMNSEISDLLASGEIVALCRGRMEWGARALGNRSIVASGHDIARIDEINTMIKMRDFWMPFAPSIKEESFDRYAELDREKEISWDFMTCAAPVKPDSRNEIIAGSHPKDGTIRPHRVTAQANPDYHAVIDGFEQKTGRGAVLNTSFNLHGEPIVRTGSDAVRVMELSGIQHLALNNHIISKT